MAILKRNNEKLRKTKPAGVKSNFDQLFYKIIFRPNDLELGSDNELPIFRPSKANQTKTSCETCRAKFPTMAQLGG